MFETGLIAPISTTDFDKKLSEYSKIAKSTLNWIKTLSTDVQTSTRLSSSFLSLTIIAATTEIIKKQSKNETKTEKDFNDKISNFLKIL